MKKTKLLVVGLISLALAACGGSSESKLVASYVGTFEGGYYIPAYSMVQPGYDNYVVDLYNDNTYVSNRVIYMNMYGTQGSVVITTTGSYATSTNEDGDKIVSLSDAASILYTTCGMFNMQYSYNVKGIENTTFPVALLGSSAASDTLEFFQGEYGFGYSFLTSSENFAITEVYLPDSYSSHFTKKDENGEVIPHTPTHVVNPYEGKIKAHDFKKEIKNVYIGTFEGGYYIPAYNMVQPGYDNYVVTIFKDGSYNALNVKYMDMYGTQGCVALRTQGKSTATQNEDGDTIINIAAADSILYNTCGMFALQYAWNAGQIADSLFPVALLGSSSASDTLDFFKSEYGYAYSFLTTETNCLIAELNLPENIAAHFAPKETPAE